MTGPAMLTLEEADGVICATPGTMFNHEWDVVHTDRLARWTANLMNPQWFMFAYQGLPLCPQFPRPKINEEIPA